MKITEEPIIVEQFFHKPIAEVWSALTELQQMRQWFFENIPDFRPEVGFSNRFIVNNEGRVLPHLWRIVEIDPLKKITYNWKYEGYAGDSRVTFELFGKTGGTKLRVSHKTMTDFSANIPEFTRESCLGGWQYFINQRLKEYLEKS